MHIFAQMFENEIKEYERVREVYQKKVAEKMNQRDWMDYNEILFSAHSCAIEGNSFTVDDTRILREQGMISNMNFKTKQHLWEHNFHKILIKVTLSFCSSPNLHYLCRNIAKEK